MKQLHYLLGAMLIAMSACSGNEKPAEVASEEVTVDSFYTADYAFADLRGKVKECTIVSQDLAQGDSGMIISDSTSMTTRIERFNSDGNVTAVVSNVVFEGEEMESMTYEFVYDEDGKFKRAGTSMEGQLVFRRGEGGFVKSFVSLSSSGDKEFVKVYTWDGPRLMTERLVNDENDRPSDVDNKTSYSYDADGNRTGMTEFFGDPQISVTETDTKFDYKDTDNHGNWTKRIVTKTGRRYDCTPGGKRNLAETVTTYLIETRDIEYY